jgi:hypothetical protein
MSTLPQAQSAQSDVSRWTIAGNRAGLDTVHFECPPNRSTNKGVKSLLGFQLQALTSLFDPLAIGPSP